MDENKEKEQPTKDSGEGIQPKADGMLKDLYTENNRSEKILEERRSILNEEKEFYARKQVGGITEAGQTAEAPKEETPKEYADKVMKNEVKSE